MSDHSSDNESVRSVIVTPYFTSPAATNVSETPRHLQGERTDDYISLSCRYEYVRSAGHSSEGWVNVVRCLDTKQLRVFKLVRHDHNKDHDNEVSPPNEAAMLRAVGDHDNILRMFETEFNPCQDVDVMCNEYCSLGDCFGLLRHWSRKKIQAPAVVVGNLIVQITEAVAYVHGGWIRGRAKNYRQTQSQHMDLCLSDIKLENIFLRLNFRGVDVVLADFGQAFDPFTQRRYGGGTKGYQSIEQASRTAPVTQKSDVYSMGVTLVALCKGAQAQLYPGGEVPVRLRLPARFACLGIKDLIMQCLQPSPNNRPEMSPRGALYHISQLRGVLEDLERNAIIPPNCWPIAGSSRNGN